MVSVEDTPYYVVPPAQVNLSPPPVDIGFYGLFAAARLLLI